MKLKVRLILLIFIFTKSITYSQDLSKLSEDKGFREIKLGSNISKFNCFKLNNSLKPFTYKYYSGIYNEISAYEFIPNSSYPYYKIGDIGIYEIKVLVYQNKIFQIEIIIEKNKDILELLKYRYGNYTSFDNSTIPEYSWNTNNGIAFKLHGYDNKSKLTVNSYILEYEDSLYWKALMEINESKNEAEKRERINKLKEQAKTQF